MNEALQLARAALFMSESFLSIADDVVFFCVVSGNDLDKTRPEFVDGWVKANGSLV